MSRVDKIAIIGVGCRFPGADNIDEFWKVLLHGENHVVDIPNDRWNVDAIYDADPDAPGKTYVRKAGLIVGHDTWDNTFFGISDLEAEQIDPQQRLVLDCVHMALENAGVRKTDLNGSSTGVYIGTMNDDFTHGMNEDPGELTNYSVTGSARSIISARVSYLYNLLGPAMTIDTACSSALVAIHTGIQAIKMGDCNMALCGGVNSILYPELFIALSKARMLSPSGQCQPFSAKADGYARGEGCGIILLKTLTDAQKDGDYIWGTIRTGCNQDGHTASPMTAPSLSQQKHLLEKVYRENNVDPCSVQYIEAHGTGTPVGDPIEVDSLGTFFMEHRAKQTDLKKLSIGSVKSNIGHTESAAGVAGIIKILLMMKNETIVPSLHSEELNPKIHFDTYGLHVVQNCTPWEQNASKRRVACVNCFGFGGTNSHAIVEQDLKTQQPHTSLENLDTKEVRPYIIAISAADNWSLEQIIRDYIIFLSTYENSIENLSYNLLCKKDHYRHRFAITSHTISQLREQLQTAVSKPLNASQTPSSRRIIFVYSGVGTTWNGMCKSLIARVPVFRQAIQEIDKYLQPKTNWSLMQKLENFDNDMDPFVSHICIFGCQIGLSRIWKYWGINPDAIIGQSVGEVAAAHVAGYLTLEEAITVIYERSRLLRKAHGGKMTVVWNLDTAIVEEMVQKTDGVSIAVFNSSRSCTLSGDADSLQEIERDLESYNGAVIRQLNVQCAYHSSFVQTSSEDLEDALKHMTVKKPTIPLYSTVTGEIAGNNFATARYWRQNVREQVLFSKAVEKSISETNMNIFLEIGPKAVLKTHADTILKNNRFCVVPSMKPSSEEFGTLLSSLKDIYQHGVNPQWLNLFDTTNVTTITQIPSYRFNRKPILFETETRQKKSKGCLNDTMGHLFLTSRSNDGYQYKASLESTKTKFVYDHKVQDVVTVPGAIYCEIALAIGVETFNCSFDNLQVNFEILNPVFVHKMRPCELYCFKKTVDAESFKFEVTKDEFGKTKVASGHVKKRMCPPSPTLNLQRLCTRCTNEISANDFYNMLSNMGFFYGETLQNFTSIKYNSQEVIAEISVADAITPELRRTFLHPAVLDAVLQSFAPLLSGFTKNKDFRIFPSAIKSMTLHKTIERNMACYTRIVDLQADSLLTNAVLLCKNGKIVAEFQNILYTLVDENIRPQSFEYEVRWQKMETLPEALPLVEPKLVCLTNDKEVNPKLESLLEGFQIQFFHFCEAEGQISHKVYQKLSSIDELSCVLYYPGYRYYRDDECLPFEIYDAVKRSCVGCLKLVQSMHLKDTPIIVVTEDTQTSSGFPDNSMNLIGSELWGMGRSITVEPYAARLYLLDIDTGTPLLGETFSSIISGVIAGSLIHAQEMLVKNNELYTNVLQRPEDPVSATDFRSNFVDPSCRVCCKSSSIASITDPFFTMQQDITGTGVTKSNEDSVVLEVENFIPHPCIFYPLTETGLHGVKTFLFGKNTDGHQILALELTGRMQNEKEPSQNELCLSHKSKVFPKFERRKVAALYPSKAMSSIVVPRPCVINLEKLPGYHIGTLQALFIAWQLTAHVSQEQRVSVFYDHNLPRIYVYMLSAMLQIRHKCTVVLRQIEDISSNDLDREVCVVFGDISNLPPDRLFTKVQLIVSLNMFISREYMNELREHNQCVTAENYEIETILDPVNIKTNFPVFKSWLQKNWKNPILQSFIRMVSCDEANVIRLPTNTSLDKLPSRLVQVQKNELFRRNACYIVTGGLTGLGWEIVKLLCLKGAGYVVTFSRRNPSQSIEQQVENIQSICGNKVLTVRVDVGDYTQLEAAFTYISQMFPNIPVKGIFHGAGILDRAMHMDMTEEKIENALRPKVLGTLNLHKISRKFILDYFVMHSSIASILGDIGQTNYAAGNSFLDGMAHFRRAHGLPGQSINWGALDLGMAKENAIRTVLIDRGFNILDVENIKSSFILSLVRNAIQITYSNFDWTRLSENLLFETRSSLKYRVRNFLKKKTTRIEMTDVLDTESFYGTEEEKYKRIKDIVQNTTSEVLQIDKEDIVDNVSLIDLGMDSQRGIEFSRILEQKTSCKVPFVFTISNEFVIVGIVQYIFENLSQDTSNVKSESMQLMRSMTYTENKVYKNVTNGSGCSMFINLEFKLCKKFSEPTLWRTILKWLISVYPELRTIYRNSEAVRFNVMKTVLPPADTIIDFRTMNEPIKDTVDEEYDPSKDLPMKAILFQEKHQSIIKIMINSIASDLKGCIAICKLVHTALVSFSTQREIPTIPLRDPIDYALMYEESLESKRQDLKDFWKEYMNGTVEFASFNNSKRKRQAEHKKGNISKSLSGSVYCKVQHYLQESDITCLQLLTCLYQCVLYCTFRCNRTVIKAKVNIEDCPDEFQDSIWESSNLIPIVLELPTDSSLSTFIKINSEKIQRCIEKSAYPFDLILSDNGIDPDAFCHEIAVADISAFDDLAENKEFTMQLHNIEIDCVPSECSLLVLQREHKQEFTFRLSFDSDAIESTVADHVLDDLVNLLWICVDKPGTKIVEIQLQTPKLISNCVDEDEISKENADCEVRKL